MKHPSGDQMPLHQNGTKETFVKESVHLSREHETVFTQFTTDESIRFLPQFLFKETGGHHRQHFRTASITNEHQKGPSYLSKCLSLLAFF